VEDAARASIGGGSRARAVYLRLKSERDELKREMARAATRGLGMEHALRVLCDAPEPTRRRLLREAREMRTGTFSSAEGGDSEGREEGGEAGKARRKAAAVLAKMKLPAT
jgi:hypothetical protein